MTRTPKNAVCGCLVEASVEEFPALLNTPGVDLLEWRLDTFIERHSFETTLQTVPLLSTRPRRPILVTNRPVREGGAFEGPEDRRLQVLREAVSAGAEWVDLESDTPQDVFKEFKLLPAGVITSHHEFSGTPDRLKLQRLVEEMANRGTGIVKIVTLALCQEDNLRVLELIPFGRRELGIEVIAFCMGPHGKWSRLVCLFLGSPWTYAQLPGQPPAAAGQFTADELRSLLEKGCWTPDS